MRTRLSTHLGFRDNNGRKSCREFIRVIRTAQRIEPFAFLGISSNASFSTRLLSTYYVSGTKYMMMHKTESPSLP